MTSESLPTADETLDVYLARHRTRGGPIYLILLMLVFLLVLALPLVRLEVTVASPGIIRPVAEKHEVRARTAGLADSVVARLGAAVSRGDPLVTLRHDILDERRRAIVERLAEQETLVGDLRLLTSSPDSSATGTLRSARFREEHAQLLREIAEAELKIEEASREAARAVGLAMNELIPAQERDRGLHLVSQLEASRDVIAGRQMRLWQTELLEARSVIARLRAELRELEKEREMYGISAPIDGTIEELAAISPGSYVQAGDVVAVLSPETGTEAEVYVSPADIGLLRVGMPVRVLVDAFNYHDWGAASGRVHSISGDFLTMDGAPSFRVKVRLDSDTLVLRNGTVGTIRKGMTVQARFVVGSRTPLQLLRDDLNDWIHPWDQGGPSVASAR